MSETDMKTASASGTGRGHESHRSSALADHVDLMVGGMTCPHCPPAIERALKNVADVTAAHVNLADETAHVEYDPSRAEVADLLRAIRSVGYTLRPTASAATRQ